MISYNLSWSMTASRYCEIKSDANLLKAAALFMSSSANVKDIEDSGHLAMIAIYSGRQNDTSMISDIKDFVKNQHRAPCQ